MRVPTRMALGNRLSASAAGSTVATYQPNALNQYDWIDTGSGPLAPSHDEDGNLEHDGTKIYGWDAENRLVSVKRASDNQPIAGYAYDYMGRRIHKQTTAIAPQGAGSAVFVYEGWNLSAEYAVSGSPPSTLHPQRTYTWGLDLSGTLQGAGGVGGLLAFEYKNSGSSSYGVYYPLYDGNGNVLATLKDTGTSTAVAGAYHYDPFGKTLLSSGANVGDNPFRFSTKYSDGETGFYYYGYRYYDPVTGRWPSRDPLTDVAHQLFDATKKATNRSVLASEVTAVVFAENDGINKFDLDGRLLGCRSMFVANKLLWADGQADENAPDGTTHHNGENEDSDNDREGGDADALTHCIAGCSLGRQFGWLACSPYGLYEELQNRENGANAGSRMDMANNLVGWGTGRQMGFSWVDRDKGCVDACLNLLRSGGLTEIDPDTGETTQSSVPENE